MEGRTKDKRGRTRAALRFTIRFNPGTERPWGYPGGGFDSPEPAMLAAWEVLRSNDEALEAIIYHGDMYLGRMKSDGRLYDAELRQIGLCITYDRAEMLV